MNATVSSDNLKGAIDPHAHIYPPAFMEDIRRGRFGRTVTLETESGGACWVIVRGKMRGQDDEVRNKLTMRYYDLATRFEDMERMGVERHILSIAPAMTFYTLEAAANREIAASMNEGLCALTKAYPEKFSCMATIPLQDPTASVEELERASKAGHIGVLIASNVAGMNLHDPSLDVFWEKVSALNWPVYIHPQNVCGANDRLKAFYLKNFIGNPLDTTIAVACLMFGGVLDRYPKLRFCLSHMGGFFPWNRGRWEHGYGEREEPKVNGAGNPEQYYDRFYYDTITHNADCLEFAVKILGADRIVYGTDYPYDMGYHQPSSEIPGLSRLSKSDQERILYANAKKLYGL